MTTQSLLATRRAFVNEQSREHDPAVKAMCQYSIDEIDRELASRQVIATVPHRPDFIDETMEATRKQIENCAEGWSVAQHCRGEVGA